MRKRVKQSSMKRVIAGIVSVSLCFGGIIPEGMFFGTTKAVSAEEGEEADMAFQADSADSAGGLEPVTVEDPADAITLEVEGITYTLERQNQDYTITGTVGSGTTADLVGLNDKIHEEIGKAYNIVGIKDKEVFGHSQDGGINHKTTVPNITTLKLPNSIVSLPEEAFTCHPALQTVEFEETGTKEQSKLKTVGDGAFSHCKQLSEVTIPSSLEKLGNAMFYDCNALADVKFNAVKADGTISPLTKEDPSGKTQIKNLGTGGTFYYDYSIKSMILPATLTDVQGKPFEGVSRISELLVLNKSLDLSDAGFFYRGRDPEFAKKGDFKIYTLYEENETVNAVKTYAESQTALGCVHEYLSKSLDISVGPDGKYYYSDDNSSFDPKGMKITAVYYNADADSEAEDEKKEVSVESYMVSDYNPKDLKDEGQNITIKYGGAEIKYRIKNYYPFNRESVIGNVEAATRNYPGGEICYTGKAITLGDISVKRSADEKALTKDKDYTISYKKIRMQELLRSGLLRLLILSMMAMNFSWARSQYIKEICRMMLLRHPLEKCFLASSASFLKQNRGIWSKNV